VIRDAAVENQQLAGLLPHIVGNMGFVFTNEDLISIRDIIVANKVPAAARGGQIAPKAVVVPAGMTPLDPGQTNFFQALNIATKISRGAIEILTPVNLIAAGDRVSSSAVILLNKLGIRPFSYSICVVTVYEDGAVYDAKFLDMTDDELGARFGQAASKLAALCFGFNYPCMVTVPHSFGNALKKLIALSLATEYVFDESKQFKEFLDNPELLAAARAAAGGGGAAAAAGGGDAGGAAAVEVVEEEEEEDEAAADMFGDAGGDY